MFDDDAVDPEIHPVRDLLERIGDRWTADVVRQLSSGTKRFSELRKRVPGISVKMLTQTLRSLERDGLVHRHAHATVPPRVDYSLTPLGETLLPPLETFAQWAGTAMDSIQAARAVYDAIDRS